MKFILFILLAVIGSSDPVEISKTNKLIRKANEAFENKDYQTAAMAYSTLYDSMGVDNPAIGLNLAHSYFHMGDTSNAKLNYQSVASANDKQLKSIAYQQLGVMAKSPQTLKESLQYLKAALKANPYNEEARYNYEVVKKLLQEQEEQQQDQNEENQDQENQDQENQDQENQDQENQDRQDQNQQDQENQDQQESNDQQEGEQDEQQKDGEQEEQEQQDGEQSEEEQQQQQQKSTEEKLKEMNISEEKAKMILEAMKNNEIQYIQQQKRKATEQPKSGKPDW